MWWSKVTSAYLPEHVLNYLGMFGDDSEQYSRRRIRLRPALLPVPQRGGRKAEPCCKLRLAELHLHPDLPHITRAPLACSLQCPPDFPHAALTVRDLRSADKVRRSYVAFPQSWVADLPAELNATLDLQNGTVAGLQGLIQNETVAKSEI